MPTRPRATYKKTGERVTLLVSEMPKSGSVAVRRATGFTEKLPVKELEPISTSEPGAALTFKNP